MKALPDLEIAVQRRHMAEDAILVEVVVRGTHLGGWRGLPATGRRVEFPLCGVYTFDADDRLAGERIYYDRGSVLRQLGVFHEPRSILGQICIVATHPITIARAFVRKLLRNRPSSEALIARPGAGQPIRPRSSFLANRQGRCGLWRVRATGGSLQVARPFPAPTQTFFLKVLYVEFNVESVNQSGYLRRRSPASYLRYYGPH